VANRTPFVCAQFLDEVLELLLVAVYEVCNFVGRVICFNVTVTYFLSSFMLLYRMYNRSASG
jgi:hypothetical protein